MCNFYFFGPKNNKWIFFRSASLKNNLYVTSTKSLGQWVLSRSKLEGLENQDRHFVHHNSAPARTSLSVRKCLVKIHIPTLIVVPYFQINSKRWDECSRQVSRKLLTNLHNIQYWLRKWRIKANETNSLRMKFTTRKDICLLVELNNCDATMQNFSACIRTGQRKRKHVRLKLREMQSALVING